MPTATSTTDQALLDFAHRFVRRFVRMRQYDDIEQRTGHRKFFIQPISLWQLGGDGNCVGLPIPGVTRDYSENGLGIFADCQLATDNYQARIHFPDRDVDLKVRVVWCQTCGPYYFAGGPIMKVYE